MLIQFKLKLNDKASYCENYKQLYRKKIYFFLQTITILNFSLTMKIFSKNISLVKLDGNTYDTSEFFGKMRFFFIASSRHATHTAKAPENHMYATQVIHG